MGSESVERLGAVGVSETSSFLFFSRENNLIEQKHRRESATGRSVRRQPAAHAGSAQKRPDLFV